MVGGLWEAVCGLNASSDVVFIDLEASGHDIRGLGVILGGHVPWSMANLMADGQADAPGLTGAQGQRQNSDGTYKSLINK
jgi:hypothetical protein